MVKKGIPILKNNRSLTCKSPWQTTNPAELWTNRLWKFQTPVYISYSPYKIFLPRPIIMSGEKRRRLSKAQRRIVLLRWNTATWQYENCTHEQPPVSMFRVMWLLLTGSTTMIYARWGFTSIRILIDYPFYYYFSQVTRMLLIKLYCIKCAS